MSSLKPPMVRIAQGLCLALVFAMTLPAQEGRNAIGTTIDLVGGGTNSLSGVSLGASRQNQPFFFFYGAYPSLNIVSTGSHSVLNASYAFGFNRTDTDQKLHSNSHSASMRLSTSLSQNFKLTLSEAFTRTDDAATFSAFRGVPAASDDFRFVFNPVALRLSSNSNTATIGADYGISEKSILSLSGSYSLRDYGSGQQLSSGLSNQQRTSATITYKRQTGAHDTWTLGYTGAYFNFDSFQDAASHSVQAGWSTQIARNLTFEVTTGASQTEELGSRKTDIGYNASINFKKTVQANSFSIYYTQVSGDSSGLGSISNTQRTGLSWSRANRNLTMFLDIAAFDTTGNLGNTFNSRGIQGAATIGVPLTRTLAVESGVQYQKYDKTSIYAFTQKRVFVSLRYNNPALLSFAK